MTTCCLGYLGSVTFLCNCNGAAELPDPRECPPLGGREHLLCGITQLPVREDGRRCQPHSQLPITGCRDRVRVTGPGTRIHHALQPLRIRCLEGSHPEVAVCIQQGCSSPSKRVAEGGESHLPQGTRMGIRRQHAARPGIKHPQCLRICPIDHQQCISSEGESLFVQGIGSHPRLTGTAQESAVIGEYSDGAGHINRAEMCPIQ